jgi:hypothetical protein
MTKMVLRVDAFDGIRALAEHMGDRESLDKIIEADVAGATALVAR